MSEHNEFMVHVDEACIAIDAAYMAAQSFSQHGIVPSSDLEGLLKLLGEAVDALTKLRAEPAPPPPEFDNGGAP